MLSKGGWTYSACIWAVLLAASVACAATPEKLFEEIFGAEAKRVTATPAKTDDVEFAQKLLKSSNTLTEEPALRAYLCEKAYEYGMQAPTGYPTAQTALNLLDTLVPQQKEQWDEKRLELYAVLYRTSKPAAKKAAGEDYITQCLVVGDNKANAGLWPEAVALYQQALNAATHIRSLQKAEAANRLETAGQMKEVAQLKERLKKDPENAAVRNSLIRSYVELDQPDWAVPYVNHASVGEQWRTYVPLAAKSVDALPAQVCLELGNWYKTLALAAKAKAVLAQRARNYYVAYLRKARAEGATADVLAEAHGKIDAALVQIGQPKLPPSVASHSPAAEEALKKAVAYLWSQQTADGSWPSGSTSSYYTSTYGKGYYSTYPTAAALLALLRAGASMSDKRVTKALNFLGTTNTPITEGVAMRTLVWYEAQLRRSGIFYKGLKSDVGALLIATKDGGYYTRVYTTTYAYSYNANSWCPPIAVDAGARARLRVPRKYWQLVVDYWAKQQTADGGWPYRASSSSSYGKPNCLWTAIGTATVATGLRNLYGHEAVKRMSGANYAPLKKGLAYLEKDLRSVASLKGPYSSSYSSAYGGYGTVYDGLWCLSRLGLATGRTRFGHVDWIRAGSEYLVSTQKPDGSWGGDIDTSRAILFLVNCSRAEKAGLAGTTKVTVTPPVPVAADDPVRKIALKKLGLMKERLAKDPSSTSITKEIVRLYVVELQDPGPAMPYAARTGDKETLQLAGLASKAVTSLTDAECLRLGKWYTELAGDSSIPGRKHAYSRAEACYERFLKIHEKRDADYLKAKLGLQGVQAELAGLKKD